MGTVLEEQNETRSTETVATSDRLAVIVPVYNEERTVAELLRRLEVQPCVSQIIIVDDGSTDRTYEELKPWRAMADSQRSAAPTSDANHDSVAARFSEPSIIFLRHEKNCGKGRAIRTALDHVTSTHVIIQDADLEYDPTDINKLWAVMLSGNADVVFGSRYLDNPHLQRGRWLVQSGVRFLNLLVRMLYGVKLTDEATCYKMFRMRDLRRMDLRCEQFEFCPEVIANALNSKLLLREVAVRYVPRSVACGKKLQVSDGGMAAWVLISRSFGAVRFWSRKSL